MIRYTIAKIISNNIFIAIVLGLTISIAGALIVYIKSKETKLTSTSAKVDANVSETSR